MNAYRTARVKGDLPDEIDEPRLQKVEADAYRTLLTACLSDLHPRRKLLTMP